MPEMQLINIFSSLVIDNAHNLKKKRQIRTSAYSSFWEHFP